MERGYAVAGSDASRPVCDSATWRVPVRAVVQDSQQRPTAEPNAPPDSDLVIGQSPIMSILSSRIDVVAQSDATVIVTGETGTGKELVARTIHERGPRRHGPFVAVNCAAFPETLLEAELFGHERGAFTGATRRRDGRFKTASGGTLLLDEVGEMPLSAQIRLLRVLQEKRIEPLGSDRSVPVDVRVIAATHRNLRELVAQGRFREDLHFRLNVLELVVPPLRDRKSDLMALFAHYLRRFTRPGDATPGITPAAWAALENHSYPGNVREFAHAVERGLVLSRGGDIDVEHLPCEIAGLARELDPPKPQSLAMAAREFERQYLLKAVRAAPTRSRAAEILGISRKTLWEKLVKHRITATEADGKEEQPGG
jgi:DNA-binding NtrC family response regulator